MAINSRRADTLDGEAWDMVSAEHEAILENIGASLALVEESLMEIRSQTADVEKILERLLSMRSLARQTDAQIGRAGELLTLNRYLNDAGILRTFFRPRSAKAE